ncbi:MAG: hypothetical protein NUW21_05205 [Elusimicrobia bacterium]|nr:hypothetical protein [Elusimicrobiota bacterium]
MKATTALAGLVTAISLPLHAWSNPAVTAMQVKEIAGAAKEVWGVIKDVTIDIHAAVKSQAPTLMRKVDLLDVTLPDNCEPFASFDSNETNLVRFSFGREGRDEAVHYQLIWGGVKCGPPEKYAKDGPAEWHFLNKARLVPIKTVVKSGNDLIIEIMNGEIEPKRLPQKDAKGGSEPPVAYLKASMELDVRYKNLSRDEALRTIVTIDAMGICTFSGNTDVLRLISGECFVDTPGVNRTTIKAKTSAARR